ncbi:MAG: SGNH/GDSL hydrolase family protein [Pseudomonadota bacterium]
MRTLLFWIGFILVLPQALWVRKTAPRTPAADGPRRAGPEGQPDLNLLGLGDSIIDGVGVSHSTEALTAQLADSLQQQGYATAWTALGESGSRTARIATLLDNLPQTPFGLVVISAGVNDVTGLTGRSTFLNAVDTIARRLQQHSPDAQVLLLGVPPMWRFPALPQPLRWVIGQRARLVQTWGRQAADRAGWRFVPSEFEPRPEEFAADGYHPNADAIKRWAASIAEEVEPAQRAPRAP